MLAYFQRIEDELRHLGSWECGCDTSLINQAAPDVTEVIANGDELNYIIQAFSNLRHARERTAVTWYGDDAKFICANVATGVTLTPSGG